jgi:8-oxo-(d)GTP phosphatase
VRRVTIYLIRHAHAAPRSAWAGDDSRRPLSPKGRRQSEHLRELLAGEPTGRILTSPARRCIETVTPLAVARGVPVEEADELAEGAGGKGALRLALRHAGDNPVLCSHGDVIPRILTLLHAAGVRSVIENVAAKGSLWTFAVGADGTIVSGTYHPPA